MQHPFINVACELAYHINKTIIVRNFNKLHSMPKGSAEFIEFFGFTKRAVAEESMALIRRYYPHHSVIVNKQAENIKDTSFAWFINPIDGMDNYLNNDMGFSTSIVIKCNNNIEHAVIYNPVLDELFVASKGHGAFLNTQKLTISSNSVLAGSCIYEYIEGASNKGINAYSIVNNLLLKQKTRVRNIGNLALSMANVACNRASVLFAVNAKEQEAAAGYLLMREAGAVVSDFKGYMPFAKSCDILAANLTIYKQVASLIKDAIVDTVV